MSVTRAPFVMADRCPVPDCGAALTRHESPTESADILAHAGRGPYRISRFDLESADDPAALIDEWVLWCHPERRPHPMDVGK